MSNFKIEIEGLEQLREAINPKYIKKDIAVGVGLAALQLHSALSFAVHSRYNISTSLDSVFANKSSSTREVGKDIIRNDLIYNYRSVNLARFFSSSYIGNINPNAKRPGVVHRVTVVRGRERVSFGYNYFGGFIPKGHRYMLERNTKAKYPIHPLTAPSLSRMAEIMYDYDPKVREVKDNMIEILAAEINFAGGKRA